MMKIWKPIVLACALSLPWSAQAANFDVIEKDKKFSEKKMTINVGDSITFINEDDKVHNVYAKGDNAFDTGAQEIGQSNTIVFNSPGKVKIKCAIHPRMKMTVKVEE